MSRIPLGVQVTDLECPFGIVGAPVWVVEDRSCSLMDRDLSLDDAMDRYAEGDDRAFAMLFAGLYGKLRAFLTRLSGSPTFAEDLVQETFLRIHRARGTFARHARVVPWAYAIARNTWLEHARTGKARMAARTDSLDDDASTTDPATGPDADSEQVLVAKETARRIERALATLPKAQREAFVLLRYEGLSVEEAASVVGTTKTAIKLRAFHAYEALRGVLQVARPHGGSDV